MSSSTHTLLIVDVSRIFWNYLSYHHATDSVRIFDFTFHLCGKNEESRAFVLRQLKKWDIYIEPVLWGPFYIIGTSVSLCPLNIIPV